MGPSLSKGNYLVTPARVSCLPEYPCSFGCFHHDRSGPRHQQSVPLIPSRCSLRRAPADRILRAYPRDWERLGHGGSDIRGAGAAEAHYALRFGIMCGDRPTRPRSPHISSPLPLSYHQRTSVCPSGHSRHLIESGEALLPGETYGGSAGRRRRGGRSVGAERSSSMQDACGQVVQMRRLTVGVPLKNTHCI